VSDVSVFFLITYFRYIYIHNLQLENDNMYSIYKASVSQCGGLWIVNVI
jgi:hypothetical protein